MYDQFFAIGTMKIMKYKNIIIAIPFIDSDENVLIWVLDENRNFSAEEPALRVNVSTLLMEFTDGDTDIDHFESMFHTNEEGALYFNNHELIATKYDAYADRFVL